jgi:hypothetical protein
MDSREYRTVTYHSQALNFPAGSNRVIVSQSQVHPSIEESTNWVLQPPFTRHTYAEGHRETFESGQSVPLSETNFASTSPDIRKELQSLQPILNQIPTERRQLLGKFEETVKTPKQSAPSDIRTPQTEPVQDFKFLKLEDTGSASHEKVEIVFEGAGKYVGGVRFGRLDGYGILYTEDGSSILYEGEFEENQFNGVGIMFNDPRPVAQEASFEGVLPCNWIRYEGLFLRNKREGFGELYFKDGGKYAGEFAQDRAHGFGKYVDRKGKEYAGVWAESRLIKAE